MSEPTPTAPPPKDCKNCGKPREEHFVVNHVGIGVLIGICPSSIYNDKVAATLPAPEPPA